MANPVQILHNVDSSRVLFCYRQDDSDSLEVARYYAKARQLEPYQLCPLFVEHSNEIDWIAYYNQIELPILNWIRRTHLRDDTGHVGHLGVSPWVIILGYRLPHLVDYNGEKLAIASRIHRIGHPLDFKRLNHTYDRKSSAYSGSYWKYFDDIDNSQLYMTAVIDGPTKQFCFNLIDRSTKVSNQGYVSGKIVLDPYGNKQTEEQLNYQQEILDFIDYDIPYLGAQHTSTIDIDDPYQDPTVIYLQDDSFYWGWYVDTCSPQTFKDSRTSRVFLYNADNYGASAISDNPSESGKWLNMSLLASNPGYASSAGAIDFPDEDAYLYPRPFFNSLHRGASLGEAFLEANKFVDWKLVLVGDPLMTVNFPILYSESIGSPGSTEVIHKTIRAIEDNLNRMDRLSRLLDDIVGIFLNSPTFDKRQIFYETSTWRDNIGSFDVNKKYISGLIVALVNYQSAMTGQSFSFWLNEYGFKVSRRFSEILAEVTSEEVSSDLVYEDGRWEIDFVYNHSNLTLENVNFVIEVARDTQFKDVVHLVSSSDSKDGWWYEKEVFLFRAMPEEGFSSNYSSRRIRFISPDYYFLRHTELYYYRVYVDDSAINIVVPTAELVV